MNAQVDKSGNSFVVRIPETCAEELKLEDGMKLEIICVDRGLLLRLPNREYTLDELLDQITPENVHAETEWGTAVGREAW